MKPFAFSLISKGSHTIYKHGADIFSFQKWYNSCHTTYSRTAKALQIIWAGGLMHTNTSLSMFSFNLFTSARPMLLYSALENEYLGAGQHQHETHNTICILESRCKGTMRIGIVLKHSLSIRFYFALLKQVPQAHTATTFGP